MTKAEFDAQMQRLKMEYTRKSNDINRRKDEVTKDKYDKILDMRTRYAAKKAEIHTSLNMHMEEKAKSFIGDPKREALVSKIKSLEHRLSMLKEEVDIEIRTISRNAHATRLALDDEARRLTEWYESEKTRMFDSYEDKYFKQLDL